MGLILPVPATTAWQGNVPATPSATFFSTTVTAHASLHTKGDYAELVAATTYESFGFWLYVADTQVTATQTDMLLDIAIGAAAAEVVILPNLLVGWRAAIATSPLFLWMPIRIPKGSRVSARCQALITGDTATVGIILNGGTSGPNGQVFVGCDAYGINAAASQGTSHTPGSTGAESSDADIGGTTSRAYGAVLILVQGSLADTTMAAQTYHWEVTRGGVTIAEWLYRTTASEQQIGPFPPAPFNVRIPAGTQLQVQAESQGAVEAQDVALYCFY